MFAQISNIVGKEWRELIRDRRTLMTLIFMALAFPAYVFFLVNMAAKRSDAGVDIEAYLVGEDQAPNMVRFLEEQGVTFTRFETREAALDDSNPSRVLLELESDFRKTYEDSLTATVNLYVNQKDDNSAGNARQLRRFLSAYDEIVSQGRMIARGVSPVRVNALEIEEYDLTTAGRASNFLAGFILYMFILTAFSGTISAAADIIAGEKERQTLQPLLAQPVTRPALVFGKWLSLATLGGLFCAFAFVVGGLLISKAPLAAAGATFYLGWHTLAFGALSLAALALFATSLQLFVAANAKSYREAMTYLPWTALAPLAVTFVPMFTDIEYGGLLSFMPIFNQTFVMRELLLEGVAPPVQYFAGIGVSIGAAFVLLALTMRIFGSEKTLDA